LTADVEVHVDLQYPIADLVTLLWAQEVLLGQGDVVRRWDVRLLELLVVSDAVGIRVLNGVVQVDVPVQEDVSHLVVSSLLVGLTGVVESLVGSDLLAVSEKGCAKLGVDTVKFVFRALTLEQKQVGYHKELHEFSEDRVASVADSLLKILGKFLEHLAKDLKLNFVHGC